MASASLIFGAPVARPRRPPYHNTFWCVWLVSGTLEGANCSPEAHLTWSGSAFGVAGAHHAVAPGPVQTIVSRIPAINASVDSLKHIYPQYESMGASIDTAYSML